MDKAQFQQKIRVWLDGHDPVNAVWSLERTNEPNTVIISAFITKNIIIGMRDSLRIEIKGTSMTEDTEATIQSAVLSLNESILKQL